MRLTRVTLKDPIFHPALPKGHFQRDFSEPDFIIHTDGETTTVHDVASNRWINTRSEVSSCELHETERARIKSPPPATQQELTEARELSEANWEKWCSDIVSVWCFQTTAHHRWPFPAHVVRSGLAAVADGVVWRPGTTTLQLVEVFEGYEAGSVLQVSHEAVLAAKREAIRSGRQALEDVRKVTSAPAVPSWWYPIPGHVWVTGRLNISLPWGKAKEGIETARGLSRSGCESCGHSKHEFFTLAACEGFGDNISLAFTHEDVRELRQGSVKAKLAAWGDVEARDSLRAIVA